MACEFDANDLDVPERGLEKGGGAKGTERICFSLPLLPCIFYFFRTVRRDEGEGIHLRSLWSLPSRVCAYLLATPQHREMGRRMSNSAQARAYRLQYAPWIARYDWGIVPPPLRQWHEDDVMLRFLDHTIQCSMRFSS